MESKLVTICRILITLSVMIGIIFYISSTEIRIHKILTKIREEIDEIYNDIDEIQNKINALYKEIGN